MSFIDKLKRLSGSISEDNSPSNTPNSPRTNVWQSVFNPGHNFNPKAHGKDYYDSPTSDNKTTWDFHIDSQKKKDEQATPDPNISKPVGGGEKMMDISKVESLLKSSRSGDGRVDVDEFIAKLKSQG